MDLYQQKTKLTDGAIADEAYITESMMDPKVKIVAGYKPLMPRYQGRLEGAGGRGHGGIHQAPQHRPGVQATEVRNGRANEPQPP